MRDETEHLLKKLRDDIERLRKKLPELLEPALYRETTGRCTSSAYTDLRTIPGLGIRLGNHTFFSRDVTLAEIARRKEAALLKVRPPPQPTPQPWIPLKDRSPRDAVGPAQRRARRASPNKIVKAAPGACSTVRERADA